MHGHPADGRQDCDDAPEPAIVRGPTWAKFPILGLGALGVQILMSVEAGYGEHRHPEVQPEKCLGAR